LSDRLHRRKPIAVAGYLLTGLSTGFFALATSWPHVLVTRAVGWFGRGARGPVRDSLLAESVPPEARGRAFGFDRSADTLGAIVGPLFALLLLAALRGRMAPVAAYRWIFLLTAIPGILSALAFAFMVRERAQHSVRAGSFLHAFRDLPRNFKRFLVGVGVFGAGDFAHTLLTLRAAQLLTPEHGAAKAGQIAVALFVVHNVFYAAMSYPVGLLADRVGKRGLLALGYSLAGVMGLGWIVATPSVVFLGTLFALGGVFIAAEDTLEKALAADLLPADLRGTGFGALAAVNGLGDFLSSAIVGLLWTAVDPRAGFAYATALFLTGAVVMSRLR
jgi:MFS family permease